MYTEILTHLLSPTSLLYAQLTVGPIECEITNLFCAIHLLKIAVWILIIHTFQHEIYHFSGEFYLNARSASGL